MHAGLNMLPQSTTSDDLDTSTSQSPGLSVDERRTLLAWVEAAREIGIDATEDLRLRPWPLPVAANVIGVFRADEGMAAWLVVGQGAAWTVVSVREGGILATTSSLTQALDLIYQPRAGRHSGPLEGV